MRRLVKKLPFRELTIMPIMMRGKLSNYRRHITPFRELAIPHGSLRLIHGTPLVRVRGTPREMGRAMGTLVGVQAAEVYHSYLRFFSPDMKGDLKIARRMESRLPHWLIEEMRGMAETCELTYDEVLLGQCFLDIHKVALCSTIAAHDAMTDSGETLIGRNLDFPSLDIAHEANIVVVYEPEGGRPYAGVTWPGFLGLLTGMNDRGLALSMMLVYGQARHEHIDGQPFPTVFRGLLRDCASVREADAVLQTRPFCTATNLVLADAGRTAARFQLHPSGPVVDYTTPETPAIACTNHYLEKRIKAFAFTWFSSVLRYAKLRTRIRRKQPVDVAVIKKLLQATAMQGINMQRVIMRPERLEMEVAFENLGRGPGVWIGFSKDDLFPAVNAGSGQPSPSLVAAG